jgi:hypothetical protein
MSDDIGKPDNHVAKDVLGKGHMSWTPLSGVPMGSMVVIFGLCTPIFKSTFKYAVECTWDYFLLYIQSVLRATRCYNATLHCFALMLIPAV